MKLDTWDFFENLLRKFNFIKIQKKKKKTSTLNEYVSKYLTIIRLILLEIRNVLDKSCRENQNTHFVFNNLFSKNRTVY
jgi:hypothetical protein